MLRINKLSDAEYLLRQVALGVDDYYMGSGEAPGVWQGRLAAELGLAGVVEGDHLRVLLLGRHPVSDVELLPGRRARTVAAFDVTFSAPKSVSLLWAFGSPEVASMASIAHVEAVTVALDFLERRGGATRQVVDGERQRIPAGVAAATFVHRTSREGDPQLHSHCVVVNLGRRPDDTFAALDATPLYEWGKAAGSVYQAEQDLYWAHHRVQRAEERLGRLGPLSQLCRHGRREKASALDDIGRFTGDVRRAEAKVTTCRDDLEDLRARRDHRKEWDAEHDRPDERLCAVDAELHALMRPARDSQPEHPTHLAERAPGSGHSWLDHFPETARPPLPGHDHGIDLGL